MPEAPDPLKSPLWRDLDKVARGIDPARYADIPRLRPHLPDYISWREHRRQWRLYRLLLGSVLCGVVLVALLRSAEISILQEKLGLYLGR